MLVCKWQKKFKDGFTNLKYCSRPGQPKLVVTNANMSSVACLMKRDTRRTVKDIAHCFGISWESAHKILTQELKLREVCARCAPIA